MSSSLKNWAISILALSSESEPWTVFSPTLSLKALRMVPSSAFAGLVAPDHVAIALHGVLALQHLNATTGPEVMKSTSSPKKGRSLWIS